jgi:cell shape-determining protein MreC
LKQSLTELEQLRHERVQLQNQLNELEALKKENAQLKRNSL